MPVRTKEELRQENTTYFPDNSTNEITAADLRTFNLDVIDSMGTSSANEVNPSTTVPLMDSVATLGTDAGYARGDHRHPSDTAKANLVDIPSPYTTAPTDVSNSAGAQGTATLYARGDHRHYLNPIVFTSRLSSTTPTVTDILVGSAGTSEFMSRADHKHQMTDISISGLASNATPSSVAIAANPGTSSLLSRGDHIHNIQLKTVAGTSLLGTGNVVVPLLTNDPPLYNSETNVAVEGTSSTAARSDHKHPQSFKTVNNQSIFGTGNIATASENPV